MNNKKGSFLEHPVGLVLAIVFLIVLLVAIPSDLKAMYEEGVKKPALGLLGIQVEDEIGDEEPTEVEQAAFDQATDAFDDFQIMLAQCMNTQEVRCVCGEISSSTIGTHQILIDNEQHTIRLLDSDSVPATEPTPFDSNYHIDPVQPVGEVIPATVENPARILTIKPNLLSFVRDSSTYTFSTGNSMSMLITAQNSIAIVDSSHAFPRLCDEK